MDNIDFSNCKLSGGNPEYGGRYGEKRGIIHNGECWPLKFPKNIVADFSSIFGHRRSIRNT